MQAHKGHHREQLDLPLSDKGRNERRRTLDGPRRQADLNRRALARVAGFGYLILGEGVSWVQALGGLAILIGFFVAYCSKFQLSSQELNGLSCSPLPRPPDQAVVGARVFSPEIAVGAEFANHRATATPTILRKKCTTCSGRDRPLR